jgi:murein DD-endopeptidase MepM/ murein hydrolase activator NlpD
MKKICGVLALMGVGFCFNVFAGTLFRLPLGSNPGYLSWFDHNASAGALTRYDCVHNFQYDNHHGTDYATSMGTSVYSATSGSLYYRLDGCADNGNGCGNGFGNHARIQHPQDGKVSIYAHLKNGTVVWPQSVLCSKKVGLSGSSGDSTAPHLHFEVWSDKYATQRIDPYGGSCSNGGVSLWVNQNGGWPTTKCQ